MTRVLGILIAAALSLQMLGCASGPPDWFQGDGVELLDPFPGADEQQSNITRPPSGQQGPFVSPGSGTANTTREPIRKDPFADKVTVVTQRADRIVGTIAMRVGLLNAQEEPLRRMLRTAELQQSQLSSLYKKDKPARIESGWNLYQSLKESIERLLQGDQLSEFRSYADERLDAMKDVSESRAQRMAELRQMRRDERARKERERAGVPDQPPTSKRINRHASL